MEEFHKHGRIVKGANSSFILLIPEKKNPTKLAEFIPTSLIGCIYKVIVKVLANRLQKVMGSLISDTQSMFISGRQIVDGILIANELWMKKNERKNKRLYSKGILKRLTT